MKNLQKLLSVPILESIAGAMAGAIAARAGTGAAVKALGDPRFKHHPEYYKGVKRASWILGAALGGANPWMRDADFSTPASLFSSMTNSHSAAGQMFDPTPFLGTVDKDSASRVVESDLFLRPYERQSVLGLISNAPEKRKGATSQFGLTQAALRAGVAFVPAYSFGQLAGRALGLPESTAKQLSRIGALAYALRSSGITEYLHNDQT